MAVETGAGEDSSPRFMQQLAGERALRDVLLGAHRR
jgi:hypothetical protein